MYDSLGDAWTGVALKTIIAIAVAIVYVGTEIEPRIGVWVVAFGGSFMSISLGKDRQFGSALLRLGVGIGFGLGASSIFDWWLHIPKIPIAFFFALLGMEIFQSLRNAISNGTLMEMVFSRIPKR